MSSFNYYSRTRPQVVMATAQVLFQRFWFVTSLKHFGIRVSAASPIFRILPHDQADELTQDIGMGALFLASKLEESTLRIRDIINCYSYLSSLVAYCSNPPYPPPTSFESYDPMDYFATEFYDLKDALVIAEMQILKRLGFQTQCGLPYGHLVNYLQVLELTGEKQLVNRSWGFCNDMCVTASFVPSRQLFPSSLRKRILRAQPSTATDSNPLPAQASNACSGPLSAKHPRPRRHLPRHPRRLAIADRPPARARPVVDAL